MVRPRLVRAIASLVLVSALVAGPAAAQFRRETSGVWLPPSSYAATDDAFALSLDPAAMAFLSDWSIHYVHADSGEGEGFAERGDGLYAAAPILFGVSLGASVESVRPSAVSVLAGAIEHTMLSVGAAYAFNPSFGIGATTRFLFSGDPRLSGLFSLDLAASWRPIPQVAISFIARDLTGPGYQGGGGSVARSFVLAFGIRPEGTRAFTLDAAAALDERGRVGARLMGELEIPFLGRLLASAEVERVGDPDPDVRVTTGLAIDWGQVGVGGGVLLGSGFEGAPTCTAGSRAGAAAGCRPATWSPRWSWRGRARAGSCRRSAGSIARSTIRASAACSCARSARTSASRTPRRCG
jgi:protease IV